MKFAALLALLATAAVRATNLGDSYQAVLAEKGTPKGQMQAGSNLVLNYEDASIKLRDNVVVSITPIKTAAAAKIATTSPAATAPAKEIAALKAEHLKATNRVKAIVNQPVSSVPRTARLSIGTTPYWFHDGAITPDFANVDVRTTRETNYGKWDLFVCQLNPDVYYAGKDIEFNPMTKFFYVDRSTPKKLLTEPEMIEINALYRVIARCEQKLRTLGAK